MLDRKLIALIISTAAIAATAAPAGASTTSPLHQPQANDITAGLIELESQPAAPRAAAPTTSESVKYTMFLPLEFDASKNEVSIETA